MQSVPFPRNLMSVVGTGIDKKFDYGGSYDNESKTIKEIIKNMEKFEISYGHQSDSILSFNDNRRDGNNDIDFDEPTQYKDIDKDSNYIRTTQNHDIDKDLEIKLNNNTNDIINLNELDNDNIDFEGTVEHFNGSKIIDDERKIIMIKSLCIALLFVLISQQYIDNYLIMININNYLSIMVLKTIIFVILFYLVEKFLLK
jgi:hypothetical protein